MGVVTFAGGKVGMTGNLKDITPVMTGANTPAGYEVTTSSNADTTRVGYKAFDGVHAANNVWHSTGGVPQWLQMKFPEKRTVRKFTILNPPSDQYGSCGIESFKLQGSNDGSSFTDLGAYTNVSMADLLNEFTVQNPGAYQYYRIHVISSGYSYSGTYYCQISEVKFYGEVA